MKTTTGINLIQAAPGIFVDPIKRHELALAPDVEWERLDDAGMKRIGMSDQQENSLLRLAEAGFITIARVTPRLLLLNMQSWREHIARVANDPWFWDQDGRNLFKYRGTYRRPADERKGRQEDDGQMELFEK